ncbi:MAG TPA: hypothetical protein EYP85_14010 [Armatimonadetes bacterium]|nr:hypothetical protein [Armatimonadota bacterium]
MSVNRRKKTLLAGACILVIVLSVLWVAWNVSRLRPAGEAYQPRPDLLPLGSPEAKVFIYVAVPPFADCQEPAINLLQELAKTYPQHLFVYFAPTFGDGTYPDPNAKFPEVPSLEELGRKAPTLDDTPFCSFICINGRVEFTLPSESGGERVKLWLSGPPGADGEELYSLEDLRRVVEQEIIAQYGELPRPVAGSSRSGR